MYNHVPMTFEQHNSNFKVKLTVKHCPIIQLFNPQSLVESEAHRIATKPFLIIMYARIRSYIRESKCDLKNSIIIINDTNEDNPFNNTSICYEMCVVPIDKLDKFVGFENDEMAYAKYLKYMIINCPPHIVPFLYSSNKEVTPRLAFRGYAYKDIPNIWDYNINPKISDLFSTIRNRYKKDMEASIDILYNCIAPFEYVWINQKPLFVDTHKYYS